MKDDIRPNLDSKQNRDDLEYLFEGTYRQGRDGMQCRTMQQQRSKLRNDSALELSGVSKYARERIFAWGRLCLLDWCDSSPGGGGDHGNNHDDPDPTPSSPGMPPVGPKIAAPPPPPENFYSVRFCNKSGVTPIFLVIGRYYSDVDDYAIEGWWQLKNGECQTFRRSLGKFGGGSFFYHAEGGGFEWWTANHADASYCVLSRKMGKIAMFTKCVADLRLVGFKKIQVKKDELTPVDITK